MSYSGLWFSHLFFPAQVLTKTPTPEAPKEPTRPLPSSASSTSSRTSMDEGGSESGGPASLSTKQLVYIAADIQRLQEKVHHPKYTDTFISLHISYICLQNQTSRYHKGILGYRSKFSAKL